MDPEREPIQADHNLTVYCMECGSIIEVHDPRSLILALHLQNECTIRNLLGSHSEEP